MKKLSLLVVAILLVTQGKQAAAADIPEHNDKHATANNTSKKAEKILATLRALDIADPDITEFVQSIDARTKNGYFTLHEEEMKTGKVQLRYALKPQIGVKHMELFYAPDNSHMEYTAHTNSVRANYRFNF